MTGLAEVIPGLSDFLENAAQGTARGGTGRVIDSFLPIPPTVPPPLVRVRRRPSARKRASMKTVVRNWHCRNCGRSNTTEIQLDGKVTCEFCQWVMRIQPSRERGGETAAQMARRVPRMR